MSVHAPLSDPRGSAQLLCMCVIKKEVAFGSSVWAFEREHEWILFMCMQEGNPRGNSGSTCEEIEDLDSHVVCAYNRTIWTVPLLVQAKEKIWTVTEAQLHALMLNKDQRVTVYMAHGCAIYNADRRRAGVRCITNNGGPNKGVRSDAMDVSIKLETLPRQTDTGTHASGVPVRRISIFRPYIRHGYSTVR